MNMNDFKKIRMELGYKARIELNYLKFLIII